jgi:2'-5' RNA ligase
LTQKLQVTCHKAFPLHIRAERIGFFPERGFPRVIWTSVTSDPQLLVHLHRAIQTSTLEFTSEPAENDFAGHITLGRVKKIRQNEADILANFATGMRGRVFGEWTVGDLALMKSELTPEGALHNVLATIPFGGAK